MRQTQRCKSYVASGRIHDRTREHHTYATVFAWHQMIGAYLRDSGVAWTNLHPNIFTQDLLSVWSIKGGLYAYTLRKPWVYCFRRCSRSCSGHSYRGPEKYSGKGYWFAAEVLTPSRVAEYATPATGRKFTAAVRDTESFQSDAAQSGSAFEPAYAKGGFGLFEQVEDGRIAYVGSVRDVVVGQVQNSNQKHWDHWSLHQREPCCRWGTKSGISLVTLAAGQKEARAAALDGHRVDALLFARCSVHEYDLSPIRGPARAQADSSIASDRCHPHG